MLQHGTHRHCCGITQSANCSTLDVVGNRVEQVEIAITALPMLNAVDHATSSPCLRGKACIGHRIRVNRNTTGAAGFPTMLRESSITITAPEPNIDPALAMES